MCAWTCSLQTSYDVTSLNRALREKHLTADYVIDANGYVRQSVAPNGGAKPVADHGAPKPVADGNDQQQTASADRGSPDVFVCFEPRDRRFAFFLTLELRRRGLDVIDESTSLDFERIEKAKCVVVLLSVAFQQSLRKIDELNLSLTRLRSGRPVYFVAVETCSDKTPTYIRLALCQVCLADPFWANALSSSGVTEFAKEICGIRQRTESTYGRLESSQVLALMKTACDVEYICRFDRFVNVKYPFEQVSLKCIY